MIEQHFKPHMLRPDTELVAEINKEYTLKQRLAKQHGLILFGVDIAEGRCVRVKIKSEVILRGVNDPSSDYRVNIDAQSHPLLSVKLKQNKVITKNTAAFDPQLIYVWAINEKTALKKVYRDFEAFVKAKAERAQ